MISNLKNQNLHYVVGLPTEQLTFELKSIVTFKQEKKENCVPFLIGVSLILLNRLLQAQGKFENCIGLIYTRT